MQKCAIIIVRGINATWQRLLPWTLTNTIVHNSGVVEAIATGARVASLRVVAGGDVLTPTVPASLTLVDICIT